MLVACSPARTVRRMATSATLRIRAELAEARLAIHEQLGVRGVQPVPRRSVWYLESGLEPPAPIRHSFRGPAAAAAARVADDLGLPSPVACSDMSGVWTTFFAGEWVLRVTAEPNPLMCARLLLASEIDAEWAPRDVLVDPSGEWVLERRLPGVPLTEVWFSLNRSERESLAREVCAARERIAELPAPEWLVAETVRVVESRCRLRIPAVDEAAVVAVLCRDRTVRHGDLHAGNMLVRDGRLSALVDWEHMCCAVYERDFAVTDLVLAAQTSQEFAALVAPARTDLLTHVVALANHLTPSAADPAALPPARQMLRVRLNTLAAMALEQIALRDRPAA